MLTGDLSNGAIKRTTLCTLFIDSIHLCLRANDHVILFCFSFLKKPLRYFVLFFYAIYFLEHMRVPPQLHLYITM